MPPGGPLTAGMRSSGPRSRGSVWGLGSGREAVSGGPATGALPSYYFFDLKFSWLPGEGWAILGHMDQLILRKKPGERVLYFLI